MNSPSAAAPASERSVKKVTILSFEGCPSHPPVVEMARRVVAEHGLDTSVEEVEVTPDDVVQRRFLGSPTVQVDGVDIEPAARERTAFCGVMQGLQHVRRYPLRAYAARGAGR